MKYSIIIISKNNRKYLINCLEKLFKAIPKDVEVIVVEATGSPELLPFNVKYIPVSPQEAGFSNQRNIGVRNAVGEYVIFVDDDIEVENGWFKNLTENINEENVFGCMGAVFPKVPGIVSFATGVLGHPGGGFRLHSLSKGKPITLSQVATCNTIIKKTVIEKIGLFDLRNRYGGEDTDLCIRVTEKFGKDKFKYIPNAIVWHYTTNNFFKMVKWYIRRGKSDADLFLKHTTHINYLISTSIMLKILPAVLLGFIFNWLVLPAAFLIWYFLQLFRARFMFYYFGLYNFSTIQKMMTFFIFPFIKLTADIMFDFGRIIRVCGSNIL